MEIQNELTILTSKTLDGLKQTEVELTKVDKAVKDIGTASTVAFSGKEITTYEQKLKILNTDLEKQKSIVGGITAEINRLTQLQNSGSTQYNNRINTLSQNLLKATKEQERLTNEIKKTEVATKSHTTAIKEQHTIAEKSNDIFRKLGTTILATFTVTAAIKGFKEAMNSTEQGADELKAVMEGLHFATRSFFQTISGKENFTELIKGMTDAFERGKDYEEQLDLLAHRKISNEYLTSQEAIKANDLEMIWREKTAKYTIEEKIQAGKDWIDILKIAEDRNIKTANAAYEADLRALNIKDKNIEQLKELFNFYLENDYLRADAEALNKEYDVLVKNVELTRKVASADDPRRSRQAAAERTKAAEFELRVFNLRTDSVAKYAEALRIIEGKNIPELIQKTAADAKIVNDTVIKLDQSTKRAKAMIGSLEVKSDKLGTTKTESDIGKTSEPGGTWFWDMLAKDKENAKEKELKRNKKFIDEALKQDEDKQKTELKNINAHSKFQGDAYDKDVKANKEANDKKLKDDEIAARKKYEIEQATMQTISNLANSFYSYKQTLDDAAKQKELIAAGDNAAKIKEINNKYAEKEKSRAISQAWINAILGATNAVATANNIYAGIILAAGILAEAALYTAEIQAQPVSFSKGVIKLKRGKFKRGVDTIPAYLNENESVMTAEETEENEDLFNAIRQGKRDDYIHKNFVIPEINKEYINTMKKKSDSKESDMIRQIITTGIKAELDDYKIRQKLLLLIESGDRNTERLISELQKTKKVR